MIFQFSLRALVIGVFVSLFACTPNKVQSTKIIATAPVNTIVSDNELRAINLPEQRKVLFLMGQDTETLSAFHKDVLLKDPQFPAPGGVTLYTKISHTFKYGSLAGLISSVDYGSGINNFVRTLKEFPNAALAVGLDITDNSGQCKSIPTKAISGIADKDVTPELIRFYRAEVDKLITFLKDANRPIFLRIGYEFDGPWNCYDATSYKIAFGYIKQRLAAMHAYKIATVWQSAAWLRNQGPYVVTDANHLDKYYPGDDAVDWVAFSKFYGLSYKEHQWTCDALNPEWFTPLVTPRLQQDLVLNFARAHKKPVLIAESAPTAYSTSELTSSCVFTNRTLPITAEKIWQSWFQEWFDYIDANKDIIRAAAYINTNWHTQKMWYCAPNTTAGTEKCNQGYWGDSRIQANPLILERFKQQLQKDIFVKK
jgi:hypothetical protein